MREQNETDETNEWEEKKNSSVAQLFAIDDGVHTFQCVQCDFILHNAKTKTYFHVRYTWK